MAGARKAFASHGGVPNSQRDSNGAARRRPHARDEGRRPPAQELRPWAKWLVLSCGHAGALARAAPFCFVSVLMIRALDGYVPEDPNLETVGAALNQLTVPPPPDT